MHHGKALPLRHRIDLSAGVQSVVDSSYRGVVKVLLVNKGWEGGGEQAFSVKCGYKIEKLIREKLSYPK